MISKYHFFFHENFRSLADFDRQESNDFDLFFSAYTDEESIKKTFGTVKSDEKVWIIFPEYGFKDTSLPEHRSLFNFSYTDENIKEAEFARKLFDNYFDDFKSKKICIDVSGFIKPYLIFLLIFLKEKGVTSIELLYSEPVAYVDASFTSFSGKDSEVSVRDIVTFANLYPSKSQDDLCIINVGYDSRLVNKVLSHNSPKTKMPLIGFPSLQPIMYQENIINLEKSNDQFGITPSDELLYAPANNPFITAYVLSKYIKKYVGKAKKITNIYLSPLATKPQALGMLLFYLFEKSEYEDKGIAIHFTYPFSSSYAPKSSEGIFQLNQYTLDFELFDKLH